MARSGRFSDNFLTELLAKIAGGSHYLSLCTQDPFSVANPTTVEIPGPVYARQLIVLTQSSRLFTCPNPITWSGISANVSVTHIASFDTAFGSNMEWAGPLPGGPYSYPNGGFLTVPANGYLVGIDI